MMTQSTRQDGAEDTDLEVSSLSAWYGQAQALNDISLRVRPGEFVGIVGRNGMGKSTLLRSISRLHKQTRGGIRLGATSLAELGPGEATQAGISIVREGHRVFDTFTVAEHLELAKRLAAKRRKQYLGDQAGEWFPILDKYRTMRAGYLSGGQRQMLALAMALASAPKALLLDEPSAGLAESVARSLMDTVGGLARGGLCLLIAEQDPHLLAGLVDRVYVIDGGRVVQQTTPDAVDPADVDFQVG